LNPPSHAVPAATKPAKAPTAVPQRSTVPGAGGYAAQSAALSPSARKGPSKGRVTGTGERATVYMTSSTRDLQVMGTAKVGDLVDVTQAHASGWFTVKAMVKLSGGGEMVQFCNIPPASLDTRTDWKVLPSSANAGQPTLARTGDAANPASLPQATNYAAPPAAAELAVKGAGDAHAVSPNDVRQGALGDCTFLASLRALVRADPSLISKTVTPRGAGRYAVALYKGGKRETVEVTHVMPTTAAGAPAYAQHDTNESELWVMIMEKAYAQLRGGYDKIGGSNQDAIEAITGKGAEYDKGYVYCDKSTEDQLLTYVNAALPKQPVFTSTRAGLVKPPHGIPDSSAGTTHAYSVEKVDVSGRKLDVMNPWGKSHLLGLPIADFKAYFLGCGTIKL
jgi:hypothetical protein